MWRAPYIVVFTLLVLGSAWLANSFDLFAEAKEGSGAARPTAKPALGRPRALDPMLLNAARSGDVARIRARIADGADPNGAAGDNQSALREAAAYGQEQAIDVLLAKGVRADCSALVTAIASGSSRRVVSSLIVHGAKLDEGGSCSALRAAVEHARVKSWADTEPLAEARANGNDAMIAVLEGK